MLVLFLCASFIGSEGTLLCFGKDGHMAIEFVDACNGAGRGAQLAGAENDACGPCRDIQFLGSPACSPNASHIAQMHPLMSFSPVSPLPLKDHFKQHLNLPEYSPHTALAGLHSVVLLI
ncbi:MAG: hypothetical protein ACYC69_03390 [Thermodesulfovibrionales bacterium]